MHSSSLLPKTNYIIKIETDCLLKYGEFHLIRRVDDVLENVYNEDIGYTKVAAFYSNDEKRSIELPGMSTNLLCFHCHENSTQYKTISRGSEDWDGVTIIPDVEIPNYCEKNGEHTNIYIPIVDIHNIEFDTVYPKQGDTPKTLAKKGIKDYTNSKDKDGKDVVVAKGGGIMEVKHKPTMLNYWHFELECSIEGKSISRKHNTTQKGSLNLVIEQLFSIISTIDLPEPNDYDPRECYLISE